MRAWLAAAILAAMTFGPAAWAEPGPGVVQEAASAPGLSAPGEIVLDHWGIAHIYGQNAHDAFFLQGWNAAHERLWQIDLWRKRGLGRLSASFGPPFVEKDRAARLLLYRGDMAAEWASYPAEAKGWTEAFVAGINAYVAEVRAGRRPLPPEFALTGSMPETWSADEVVRIRSHALVSNLTSEVVRAQSICAGALKQETLRHQVQPAHRIQVPAGLDACAVTPAVLKDYLLGTTGVTFDGKSLADEAVDMPAALKRNEEVTREGSNNWIVAASHSETGRPILANDPHREHAVPSLRYVVDISAPDLHVEGAGEPSLPGVSFGHNETAAWGLTIFYADQQDLYVYDLSKDHPGAYRYKGGWEPMRTVRETIEVKGEAPREVDLKYTRHGPVIAEIGDHAFAVRSIWDLPGGAGYFNAAWMFRATNWKDFETTHAHWGGPPLNLVYADTHGDIGWLPSAYAPVRPNWDGMVPVPGDGRYEWNGLTRPEDFPAVKNPAQGWLGTANEMNLPKGYPMEQRKLGFEWVDRSRIDEIQAVLGSKPKLSLVDMMRLQTDQHSPLAVRTVGLLAPLTGRDADEAAALAMLRGWDGTESAGSGPAALYEVWAMRHLRADTVAAVVPEKARPAFGDPQLAGVVDWLEKPGAEFGKDPKAARDAILLTSLGEAWRETTKLLGADPAKWRWGDLHFARWSEPVAALANPAMKAQMAVGPLEVGGSASTPMATSYRGDFNTAAGASVRMVLDVGAWDNSRIVNTPGQSGDPFSAHYRDLFPIWAAGGYVPLLWSREAVMANAEKVFSLAPAP
jgi:penicillin amidase